MAYVGGFVLPVPKDKIDAYQEMASGAGKIWMDHGALSYMETVWEDKKDHEMCRNFDKGFELKEGETFVFAYIVYKDRAHRDEVNEKVMADPRMKCDEKQEMPFDCKRMVFGGFSSLVHYGV